MEIVNKTTGNVLDLSLYTVSYIEHLLKRSPLDQKFIWQDKMTAPVYLYDVQKFDTLEVNFLFKEYYSEQISNFIQEVKRCEIKGIDDYSKNPVTFDCLLIEVNEIEKVFNNSVFTFKFNSIMYGQTHTISMDANNMMVDIQSAKPVEAVITFDNTLGLDTGNVAVNQWSVTKLKAGEVFVIDGEEKTITDYTRTIKGTGTKEFTAMELFPAFNSGTVELIKTGLVPTTITYRERL